MKLTDYFDKTYIINLPERKDRLWMIKHELKRAGIKLTPGKVEIFRGIRPADPGVFPNRGIRGCFLSHLTILKQAQKDDLKNVLIMEDDLAISDFFIKNEDAIIEKLSAYDWGDVFFGHVRKLEEPKEFGFVPQHGYMITSHWYGVSRKTLGPLVAFLGQWEKRPDLWRIHNSPHIDGAFSVFRQMHPDCLTLISNPCLGWQKSSRSDIQPLSLVDRTPVLRNVITVYRAIKSLVIRKRRVGW